MKKILFLILIFSQTSWAGESKKLERADLSGAIQEGIDNQVDTHKDIQEKLGVEKLVNVTPVQFEPELGRGPTEQVVAPTAEEVVTATPAKKSRRSPASIEIPVSKELKSEIESADAP